MPVRVSDLQEILTFTGAEDILVLQPTNVLNRIKAQNFSGKGFIRGVVPPTLVHPIVGVAYGNGDMYIWDTGVSEILYMFVPADTGNADPALQVAHWDILGSLAGARIETNGSLGHSDYELATGIVSVLDISHGSFYLQNFSGKLFGPVDAAGGSPTLDFTVTDHDNWTAVRGNTLHRIDVGTNFTWSMATEGVALYDDTASTEAMRAPHPNDSLHVAIDGTHGGWIYRWRQDTYEDRLATALAANSTLVDADRRTAWLEAWEFNPASPIAGTDLPWVNLRDNFRLPQEIVGEGAPIQDDLQFISGDSYFDTVGQIRYSKYTSGISPVTDDRQNGTGQAWPDVATRIAAVWGTQSAASGTGTLLLTTGATPSTLNPYYPDRLSTTGTPGNLRLYRGNVLGPFTGGGAPDDWTSWPVHSRMQGPQIYNLAVTDETDMLARVSQTAPGANANTPTWLTDTQRIWDSGWDFPGDTSLIIPAGTLLINGDIIKFNSTYVDGFGNATNKVWQLGPVSIDTAQPRPLVTWGTIKLISNNRIHNFNGISQPTLDDDLYMEGDFIMTSNGGGYGPYVISNGGIDATAWPVAWAAPVANTTLQVTDIARTNAVLNILMDDGGLFAEDTTSGDRIFLGGNNIVSSLVNHRGQINEGSLFVIDANTTYDADGLGGFLTYFSTSQTARQFQVINRGRDLVTNPIILELPNSTTATTRTTFSLDLNNVMYNFYCIQTGNTLDWHWQATEVKGGA